MKKYNLINNVLGWTCFVIAAVTYLLTLEPTASFWDCPEFISQGLKLEVGHPPGNPIFMLCARFFITLFGGSAAHAAIAVNAMSALLSAATILLLFWTITHLVRRMIVPDDAEEISLWKMLLIFGGGVCGALAYTWSDTFWFSAVEGEVYAFSSFCTALVFWLILKWENRADQPHSDRYLILIAYVIGVSIAVHLLNLLCIPAIVLVFYYRKFKNINAKGSLLALGISFVIIALILFGLVPGFVKVAQWFELLFVNFFGCSYNTGVLIYTILTLVVFVWTIRSLYVQRSPIAIKIGVLLSIILSGMPFMGGWVIPLLLIGGLIVYLFAFCKKVPVRLFNVAILSVFLIFVGYSSYALLLIRSSAETPMNQNAPDNVFALGSYLNREQYGETPLLHGARFAEQLVMEEYPEGSGNYYVPVDEQGRPQTEICDGVLRDENGRPYSEPKYSYRKVVKTSPNQPDKYVEWVSNPNYSDIPDISCFFTRIFSTKPEHVRGYKGWMQYSTPDIDAIPAELRQKWAQMGFAPLYEIAPYITHQKQVATCISHDGQEVEHIGMWVPSFLDNLTYFFNYQFSHMYWRYFMWNFAGRQNDIAGNGEPQNGNWISGLSFIDNARLGDQSLLPDEYGKNNKGHNVFYMLPLLLGVIGLLWQSLYIKSGRPQRGIEQFWVVCFLFFMTGIAIVLYLNQTPGQPRERDYAFAGSFYAFAIWIGMGVPAIGMMLRSLIARKAKATDADTVENKPWAWAAAGFACLVGLIIPLQMVSQTWDDHDRSGRYVARDFGMNFLASTDENAIIFCNGDNDTFPLWYAQEVEGFRTDVRVVNQSYLTQDWYVNQQRIPSYDAKAIPMYATRADYAGERLGYSYIVPQADTIVTAETALRQLYQSPNIYKYPVLTFNKVVLPVDKDAALKRFNVNPADSAVAATVEDIFTDLQQFCQRSGKGGLTLGNTMSLDFLANSVSKNFDRPVYFCSTVPTSYYLGLSPYMYTTGMALEITPFYNAPVSPVVEKAYQNVMGNFRWGGLDCEHPEDLYLDETVRRMIASTRSSLLEVVRSLYRSGNQPASAWAKANAPEGLPMNTRYDMARALLITMLEKLPDAACRIDGEVVMYMAESFYDLYIKTGNRTDLDQAEHLISDHLVDYVQMLKYIASLQPSQRRLMGYDYYQIDNLATGVMMLNRIAVLRKLEENKDANAEILASWSERTADDMNTMIHVMLYVDGYTRAQIEEVLPQAEGQSAAILNSALRTLAAHEAAGIEPMALSNELAKQYGFDMAVWSTFAK